MVRLNYRKVGIWVAQLLWCGVLAGGAAKAQGAADLRSVIRIAGASGHGRLGKVYTENQYYWITEINNVGDAPATSVTAVLELPEGMVFGTPIFPASGGSTAFYPLGGDSEFALDSIPPGGYASITIPMEPVAAGTFNGTATFTGDPAVAVSPNPAWFIFESEAHRSYDLLSSISSSNPSPVQGDLVTFQVACENLGPDQARFVYARLVRYDDFHNWEIVSWAPGASSGRQVRMGAFNQIGPFNVEPGQRLAIDLVMRALRPSPPLNFELSLESRDWPDAALDLNPRNNVSTLAVAIGEPAPGQEEPPVCTGSPDLAVGISKVNRKGKLNKKTREWTYQVQTSAAVMNIGDICTAQKPHVKVYLSADAVLGEDDFLIGSKTVGKLCPGKPGAKPKNVTIKAKLPAGFDPYGYHVLAVVETGAGEVECNTANNMAVFSD